MTIRLNTGDGFSTRLNALSAIASFALSSAILFFSYRYVSKTQGLSAIGLWSTLNAWAYFLRVFDAGLSSSVVRFISPLSSRQVEWKTNTEIRAFIDTATITTLTVSSLVACIGFYFLSSVMNVMVPDHQHHTEAMRLIPLICVIYALNTTSTNIGAALQGIHKGYLFSAVGIISAATNLLVVILLTESAGLLALALGILLQNAISIIFGWTLLAQQTGGRRYPSHWSKSHLKQMFQYALRNQILSFTNGLFEPLSKILLNQVATLQVQGIYELSYKTVVLVRNTIASGTASTIPALTALVHRKDAALHKLYAQTLKTTVVYTLLGMIVLALASPLISRIWIGKLEILYVEFIVLLAIGYTINSVGAPAYNLGLASGEMKGNQIASVLSILIVSTLTPLLGTWFGPIGFTTGVTMALVISGIYIKHTNEASFLVRVRS